MNKSIILKLILGIALGAIAGYGFYYLIGCQGGCPLSSNWISTTIFGGIIGLILFYPEKKNQNNEDEK